MTKFLESEWITFNKSKFVIAGNGKADGADAGIEIEYAISVDVFLDSAKSEFVDGEIDLEKAVRRIRVGVAENLVSEGWKVGMRLTIFVEATRNFTRLIGAEKNGLIFASFFMARVEIGDDLGSGLENFRVFEGRLRNGEFAMRTTTMESKFN